MPQVWSTTHINSNLSGGGTTVVSQGATNIYAPAYGSEGFATGKFYWETKTTGTVGGNASFGGIGNVSSSIANGQYLGIGPDTIGLYLGGGGLQVNWNAAIPYTAGTGASVGNVMGHALDLTNGFYWWSDVTVLAGTWYGSSSTAGSPTTPSGGFPLTGSYSGGTVTIATSNVVPAISLYNGCTGTGYFDPASWTGTPPTGFIAFDAAAPVTVRGLPLLGVGLWAADRLAKNPMISRRETWLPHKW